MPNANQFIQFCIATITVKVWDPTEWVQLYCILPYFKILYS